MNLYFSMGENLSAGWDKPWSEEEFMVRHGDAIRTVEADRIVWVHRNLRWQNILVHNGRLSGIIDWENSGWFPCHWQLHALRYVRGCPIRVCAMWKDMKFPPETEAAYQASMSLIYYHPC